MVILVYFSKTPNKFLFNQIVKQPINQSPTPQELLGIQLTHLVHPDDVERVSEALRLALHCNKRVQASELCIIMLLWLLSAGIMPYEIHK